jgi:hypothetical protein
MNGRVPKATSRCEPAASQTREISCGAGPVPGSSTDVPPKSKRRNAPVRSQDNTRLTKGPPHDRITASGLNHLDGSPTSVKQPDVHHQVESLPRARAVSSLPGVGRPTTNSSPAKGQQ